MVGSTNGVVPFVWPTPKRKGIHFRIHMLLTFFFIIIYTLSVAWHNFLLKKHSKYSKKTMQCADWACRPISRVCQKLIECETENTTQHPYTVGSWLKLIINYLGNYQFSWKFFQINNNALSTTFRLSNFNFTKRI